MKTDTGSGERRRNAEDGIRGNKQTKRGKDMPERKLLPGGTEPRRWIQWILRGLYFAAFGALMILLLQKCRYGYASPDEAFYMVTPYRLARGDRLLLDEWHMTQFASFTMIPEMRVYLLLAGSTEGIILNFRYIYTLCWSAASLFLYFRARTLHEVGAMGASLMLMSYAPYGIMAFSYNSLGILYLVNAAVFLLCARRLRKVQMILSGLFFAGAVLCCPYLAMVYLIYSAVLGITWLRKRNPVIAANGMEAAACWKYFTAGAAILALLFLGFLLSGASPARLLNSLSLAMQDEEHSNFSLVRKTKEYFLGIGGSNGYFLPLLAVLILMSALAVRHRCAVWLIPVCGAVILYLRGFMLEKPYLNYLMIPLTFAGIHVAAVSRKPEIRWVGGLWLIPGILYTFCLNYTSNQIFYAISSAATVSSLASLVLLGMYGRELKEEGAGTEKEKVVRYAACAAMLICFLFQMRYEIPLRYQSVFQEPGLMEYEEQAEIMRGPQKGIRATVKNAGKYHELLKDAERIDHQKVLYLSEQTWLYLVNENEVAAFSGWMGSINSGWQGKVEGITMNRLMQYYQSNPEKKPEVILIEKENESLLQEGFISEYSERERLPDGNWLIRP